VNPFFVRDPFEVAPDAAIVKAIDRAATKVRGAPRPHRDTPWMDAALLQAAEWRPWSSARPARVRTRTSSGRRGERRELAEILAEAALDYCADCAAPHFA